MSADGSIAHARQFKRHETRFEARIDPHADHADQFRLGFAGSASGLAVVDVSKGGLGLRSGVYLARNLRVTLHVSSADSPSPANRVLVIRAIVRRCAMIDHKPTYQVGLQFVDPAGRDEQTLMGLVTARPTDEPVLCGGGASEPSKLR